MKDAGTSPQKPRGKFEHPRWTADGQRRAWVDPVQLETLWFNTGTLCNLSCTNCYIESSPRNDRLVYLERSDIEPFLEEIEAKNLGTREIAFTGGEPFLNPHMPELLEAALARGFETLTLTNAMKPMRRRGEELLQLAQRFGERMRMRVSLDHFRKDLHEDERGRDTFDTAVEGLQWLAHHGFPVSIAARTRWGDSDDDMRRGFAELLQRLEVVLDVEDPNNLVLFPEMDGSREVPEITTECWGILGQSPEDIMCASSRMVVKRKGADRPVVLACTLLAYDEAFEMGHDLSTAWRSVSLNHPHCAKFCVLGGASCSRAGA